MARKSAQKTVDTSIEEIPVATTNETETAATEASVSNEPTLDQLMSEHKTKSAVIRYLSANGWTNSKIAKFMGIRYQHVRNVLHQVLKKSQ